MKIYEDESKNHPLKKIKWKNEIAVTMANGKEVKLMNIAEAGEKAQAEVFIVNDAKHLFIVTKITHPDERVKLELETTWLMPNEPVRLTISFNVPKEIIPEDIVKSADILIEGFYRYTEME